MNSSTQLSLLGPTDVCTGSVRFAYLRNDASEERFAIAVLGQFISGVMFARAVTPKVLKCLPQELGVAIHAFGALIVADFLSRTKAMRGLEDWTSPLGGIDLGKPFFVDAESEDGVVLSALEQCTLYHRLSVRQLKLELEEATRRPPRSAFESRFVQLVRKEVVERKPGLEQCFNRTFSLTKSDAGFAIDYVGHNYATCYAALDPKSRGVLRLRAPHAALWRLARARDTFGFASPEKFELTAWIPAPGVPIYTDREYALVSETISELEEQAHKEGLGVFSTYDSRDASVHLLHQEGRGHLEGHRKYN